MESNKIYLSQIWYLYKTKQANINKPYLLGYNNLYHHLSSKSVSKLRINFNFRLMEAKNYIYE
jgi:hypothetical protein